MSLKSGGKVPPSKMSRSARGAAPLASFRRDSEAMSRSSSVSTLTSTADLKCEEDVAAQNIEGYIVGDRVWVNGTKPGFIQYIGDTQFAPGLWAGVKLDEAIGKNDGCVGGVKYFECEPQRGIFARPHRLTRQAGSPPDIAENSIRESPTSKTRDTSTSLRSLAPQGVSSGSALSSPSKPGCSKLKIGERVVVSATSGTKTGILRYFGTANFAPGDWAGIELDQPLGKNDGSVAGKRYFECRMKHGLFAPPHKVSRSGGTSTPRSSYSRTSSFHNRSSSRESLNSSVSSTSATRAGRVKLGVTSLTNSQKSPKAAAASVTATHAALQEALKEKEEHIDQLLRERDLERAEVARAASKVDEVEKKISDLKAENQHYVDETESEFIRMKELLEKTESERKSAVALLDEERRKIEDLQFRLEEEIITKSELETQTAKDHQDMKQLKELLDGSGKEKSEIEAYEDTQNKLLLLDLVETKSKELSCAEEQVLKLKEELQKLSENGNSQAEMIKEKEELVQNLRIELQHVEEKVKDQEQEMSTMKVSLSDTSEQCQSNEANELLKIKIAEVEKEIQCLTGEKNSLTNEICKMQNLANSYESEQKEKEDQITQLKNAVEEKDAQLKKFGNELQSKEINAVSNEIIQKDLIELKSENERIVKESEEKINNLNLDIEKLTTTLTLKANLLIENEKQVEKLQESIEEQKSEALKLSGCVQNAEEKLMAEFEKNAINCKMLKDDNDSIKADLERLKTEKEKEIEPLIEKIAKLSLSLKFKGEQQTRQEAEVNTFAKRLEEKDSIISRLQLQVKEANEATSVLSQNQSQSVSQLQDQLSQVISEKEVIQATLEKKLEEMTESTHKLSTALKEKSDLQTEKESEIVSLNTCLSDKDVQLQNFKSALAEAEDKFQQLVEESKNNQNLLQDQIVTAKMEKEQDLKVKEEAVERLTQENGDLTGQLQEKEQLASKTEEIVSALQKTLSVKDVEISNLDTQLQLEKEQTQILSKDKTEGQSFLQTQIAQIREETDALIKEKELALERLTQENGDLTGQLQEKEQLASKTEEIVSELQKTLSVKDVEICNLDTQLKLEKEQVEILSKDKTDGQSFLQTQIAQIRGETDALLKEKERAVERLTRENGDLTGQLQEKEQLASKTEEIVTELQKTLSGKDVEISNLDTQLQLEKEQIEILSKDKTDGQSFLQTQIAQIRGETDALLKEKELALERLTQENGDLAGKLQEKEQLASKTEEIVSALQKTLSGKDVEISNLDTQLKLEKERVEILSKDKIDEQSFLQQQIAQIKGETNALLKEKEQCLECTKTEVANCISVIEAKNKEANVKQKELQTLQIVVNEKERQISQLSDLTEANQKQLNQLKQQNESNMRLLENRVAEFKIEQEKHLQEKEKHLHEEIKKLQVLLQNKESLVEDNEVKVRDLKVEMEKREKEVKKLQHTLEGTQAQLNTKLQTDESLRDVESKINILQNQYDALLKEKDEIKNREKVAQEARKELEKSKDSLLRDKIEQQALVKDRETKLQAVQIEVDRMRTEFMRHKEELQQKLDVSEMELKAMKEIKTQLEVQHEVLEELQQQLSNTENERQQLYLQVQNSASLAEEKTRLEKIVVQLQEQLKTKFSKTEEIEKQNSIMQKALEEKNLLLQQKESELKTSQTQLETVQEDFVLSEKIKSSLEEEKTLLSDKVVKLQATIVETNRTRKVDVESDTDGDEKETLLSQIDFLNSIIVDLQRKNNELRMKLEAPSDLVQNDLNFNGIKSMIAPRLFCDICDMFDLHDTDDCPKQSSFEGDESEVPHSRHHGNRHEERPYCNNCEIFGHWTLDCDDQETF